MAASKSRAAMIASDDEWTLRQGEVLEAALVLKDIGIDPEGFSRFLARDEHHSVLGFHEHRCGAEVEVRKRNRDLLPGVGAVPAGRGEASASSLRRSPHTPYSISLTIDPVVSTTRRGEPTWSALNSE